MAHHGSGGEATEAGAAVDGGIEGKRKKGARDLGEELQLEEDRPPKDWRRVS
jgi:hypothetical protein